MSDKREEMREASRQFFASMYHLQRLGSHAAFVGSKGVPTDVVEDVMDRYERLVLATAEFIEERLGLI